MANNLIQIKRTSVSGRAANTTTLSNPGELALNMTDGILYSGNGSVVFEIGANTTNTRVTGNLTINTIVANGSVGSAGYVLSSNGSSAYWANVVGYAGSFGYVGSRGANSTYTSGNTAPVSPISGDRWFNTDIGAEFVYTSDGDSSQWVEIAASGFIGQTGYTGSAGYIGVDGYTGSIGYTGSVGYTGSKGDAGSIGYTGSTGSQTITVALSDETTAITTGTAKVTIRAPYSLLLTSTPRASLSTAGSSATKVNIKVGGTTIFGSNTLQIDTSSKTSVGSTAPPTFTANQSVADDAEITYDIDTAGTGATGLKVTLFVLRQ